MMPYVLAAHGTYKKSGKPFTHFFERPGPFFNVVTSDIAKAKQFLTVHSARREIKERGLRGYKPQRITKATTA